MQRKIINLPLVDIIPSSTDSISSTTENRQDFSELQKFKLDNANTSERDIQKTTLAEVHMQCLKSSSMSTINDQKTHQKNTTEVATSNKFDESVPDFDFEESNKKFDKKFWNKDYLYRSTLKRLCDNKKEEDCFHYDKNKSFFDRITCESTNPNG